MNNSSTDEFLKKLEEQLQQPSTNRQKNRTSRLSFHHKKTKDQSSKSSKVSRLEYIADLRWFEQPYVVRKKYSRASLQVIENPTNKQIQFLIISDLVKKGEQFRKNYTFKIFDIQLKKYKPNFFARYFFGARQSESKEFIVRCSIFERKINLPRQFKYTPQVFQGFIVNDLKIENQYGSILWEGQTNINKISFENRIRIQNFQVGILIKQLHKAAIIEFYNLPFEVEGLSIPKIAKKLEDIARGAELISFDIKNNRWKLKLDFGQEQSQAQIVQNEQSQQYQEDIGDTITTNTTALTQPSYDFS